MQLFDTFNTNKPEDQAKTKSLGPEDLIDHLPGFQECTPSTIQQLVHMCVFTIRQLSMLSEKEISAQEEDLLLIYKQAMDIVQNTPSALSTNNATLGNDLIGYLYLSTEELSHLHKVNEIQSAYTSFNDYMTVPPLEREDHHWQSMAKQLRKWITQHNPDFTISSDIDVLSFLSWQAAHSFGELDCTAGARAVYFWFEKPTMQQYWEKRISSSRAFEANLPPVHVVSINLTMLSKIYSGKVYTRVGPTQWQQLSDVTLNAQNNLKWPLEGCIVSPSGVVPSECVQILYSE